MGQETHRQTDTGDGWAAHTEGRARAMYVERRADSRRAASTAHTPYFSVSIAPKSPSGASALRVSSPLGAPPARWRSLSWTCRACSKCLSPGPVPWEPQHPPHGDVLPSLRPGRAPASAANVSAARRLAWVRHVAQELTAEARERDTRATLAHVQVCVCCPPTARNSRWCGVFLGTSAVFFLVV